MPSVLGDLVQISLWLFQALAVSHHNDGKPEGANKKNYGKT